MLSEDEKEAIEKLKETQDSYLKDELDLAIETVLNLITKLQKENEEKDKQIDLMVEKIYKRISAKELDKYCNKQKNNCKNYEDCFKCIKQYFETKAKKGE